MRIASLHIDGFGVFRDVQLEALSPRLSVFCGPNESGKSTLLSFIRFMLFGFPDKRSKANRYPPLHAGVAHGGTLLLCDGSGRYRLERHDKVDLVPLDGPHGDEPDLDDLLGGITRETFNSVFAFSLHELQQLDSAFDDGAVRDALYGASAGLDHQLLSGGEQYIEEEISRLFKPRSKKAAINAALAALDDLQQKIRTAEADLGAFDQLQVEIGSLEGVIQKAQERRRELTDELDLLKELSSRMERWRKVAADVERLGAERMDLQRQRSEVRLDQTILRLASDIRELWKGRDYAQGLRKQKREAEQNLGAVRNELTTVRAALGAEWVSGRIEDFCPPDDAAETINAQQAALQRAELDVVEARATERSAAENQKAALEEEKGTAKSFESATIAPPPPDPVLCEQLLSGRGDYDRATRDLRARDGELRAEEEEFRRSLNEINPRWTEEDLQRFDTSLAARQEIERLREGVAQADKALERGREQVSRAEAEAAKAEERRRQAQEKSDAARRPVCEDPTALAGCREAHRQLALRWAAVPHESSHRWLAPAVAFVGAAAGVALLFYALAVGLVVAVAALVTGAWLWRLHRSRQATAESLQADFTALCLKLGLKSVLNDESLLEVGRAIDADIEAVRERQSLLDQFQQANRAEDDARQLISNSRIALNDAETVLRQRVEDWRRHIETMGLPVSLSPDGAVAILSRVELSRARLESIRTLRHRIQAMERNRQEYLNVFNNLLAARGQPAASHADLSVRLSQFLEIVRQEKDLREQKEKAREGWMRASENRRRVEDVLLAASRAHQEAIERQQQATAAWREWLSQNTLPVHLTPAAARDFLKSMSRARELLSRIGNIDQQLRDIADHEVTFAGRVNGLLASVGRLTSNDAVADLGSLATALQSAETAAQKVAVLDARIGEMDRQVDAMSLELDETDQRIAALRPAGANLDLDARREELGQSLKELEAEAQPTQDRLLECRRDRKAMATDERLSQMYEQRQARIEEISQAARQWAVLALARHMFDEARKSYEEQRQPAVVRRASTHLRRLTGDRYREVRMPLDGSDLHVLAAGDGPPKTVNQLSRGTAEQLYLALRFGFIEEFAGNRSPLPIIMDDILVNFDPLRATAAIEALIQLSEQLQILYFTCHPSTADKFRELDSEIPVFHLADGGIAA